LSAAAAQLGFYTRKYKNPPVSWSAGQPISLLILDWYNLAVGGCGFALVWN